ncbi:MAG: hypothetical protein KIS92_17415 [Planctomycetota bacterium]|nr:hypothetical protein [Planctomycetota bacterium]
MEADLKNLLIRFPEQTLNALSQMEKVTVPIYAGGAASISGPRLLKRMVNAQQAQIDSVKNAEMIDKMRTLFEAENPPARNDWERVRKEAGEWIAELQGERMKIPLERQLERYKVSMIFTKANAIDVLSTLAMQTGIRIRFEPHGLYKEIKDKQITARFEDARAIDSMTKIAGDMGLTFQFDDKNRFVVFQKTK